MQIVEHSIVGTRSAVLRLRRPGTPMEFLLFPMFHVASPQFYAEVAERLRRCDLLVIEGVRGRTAITWAFTMSYRIMPKNKRSGLVEDNIRYGSLGIPLLNPDIDASEFAGDWKRLPLRFRLMMWAMFPFVAIAQFFVGHRSMLTPEVEVNDLPDESNWTGDDDEAFDQLDDSMVRKEGRQGACRLGRDHPGSRV